jgi:hypothetical protein
MTHDPDAMTLAVLIYERDGWHTLCLRETAKGYRLNEELFTERRDAAHAWMDYVADLKQVGVQIREYSLYGWMTAAGTPGWEFAPD